MQNPPVHPDVNSPPNYPLPCSKRVEAIKIGEIYEPSPSLFWAAGHSQTEQQKVNAKPCQEMPADDLQDRASIQNAVCGPHKVMRSPKLCDVADVTKVAACGPGRSGRVGEIGGST